MITKLHDGTRLLEIDNVHVPDCGIPPSFDATKKYLGYFENSLGEQWVFIGDHVTGTAKIRGGDVGWEAEYDICLESPCPKNLVLNEEEILWIVTCFMAMSCTAFDAVLGNYNKAAQRDAADIEKKLDRRRE